MRFIGYSPGDRSAAMGLDELCQLACNVLHLSGRDWLDGLDGQRRLRGAECDSASRVLVPIPAPAKHLLRIRVDYLPVLGRVARLRRIAQGHEAVSGPRVPERERGFYARDVVSPNWMK